MADANEVKLFKQYLIDTKAFKTLAETLSLLRKIDPKPEDAMQFISKRLCEPIDADEFRCMKQNLGKLNEDMGQVKAEITNLSNMVSKLLPNHPTDVDQGANVSIPSMENNVGDTSHITMLNDSSLIFDQTMSTNVDDLNSPMQLIQPCNTPCNESQLNCSDIDAVNALQSKDALDDSAAGFTMEFVEVDVVNKSSLDLSLSQDDKAIEEMQVDLDESAMTSTPETTVATNALATATEGKLSDKSFAELNIDELPIVFKGEDSQEEFTLSQGFHGFDIDDVEQSKMCFPGAEIEQLVASQEEPSVETVQEAPQTHDEPVETQVLNTNDKTSEVKITNGSQDEPSIESKIDSKKANDSEAHTEPELPDANSIDEKRAIADGIMDKVVEGIIDVGESENMTEAVIIPLNGPKSKSTELDESVAENGDGCAVECSALMKDDPETMLFLSYS